MKVTTSTHNPAELGLTAAESAAYTALTTAIGEGKTVTSGDVAERMDGKNRSYIYRVLERLINKGLVERYGQRYYKLAT